MTDKQPKALKLAAFLEVSDKAPHLVNVNKSAALELRRLHEVNAELVEALRTAKELWGDFIPPTNSNAMKAWVKADAAIAKATGGEV